MFLRSAKAVNKEYIRTYIRVASLRSPRYDRNESEYWTLFTTIKLFQACFTLYAIYRCIYLVHEI